MLKKTTGLIAGAGLAMIISGCGVVPGLGGPTPVEVVSGLAKKTEKEVNSYSATYSVSGTDVDVEYTADPEPTIRMKTSVQGTETTMLMRGSEMVMDASSMGMSTGGPKWVRLDLGDSGLNTQKMDPLSEVEKLLAAKDVQEAGTESIDGTETTKYSGSYTTEEALAQIEDKEMKEAAKKQYQEKNIDSIDFEVWVDDEGLPRRVATSGAEGFEMTLDFHEFNQPVQIDYPSKSEIGDMNDMMPDTGGF